MRTHVIAINNYYSSLKLDVSRSLIYYNNGNIKITITVTNISLYSWYILFYAICYNV